MTTTTSAPQITDWTAYVFAAIEESVQLADIYGRPTFSTIGHDTASCSKIQGRVLTGDVSLDEYLARHEFFDGEVVFETPWPCSCVRVLPLGRILNPAGAETIERHFGTGTGSARSALVERTPEQTEAIEYARTYSGTFEFMVAMKEKAQRAAWVPTPNMVSAILASKAREARETVTTAPEAPTAPQVRSNRFAGSCASCGRHVPEAKGRIEKRNGSWIVLHLDGECETSAPAAPASGLDLSTLPQSAHGILRVAVPDTTTGQIVFLAIAQRRRNGSIVVRQEVGGHDDLYLGRQMPGGSYQGKRSAEVAEVLRDPRAAVIAYGLHFTRCGHCGIQLTDTKPGGSVERGIGPVCSRKMGW